jgi:hypothetical protein
LESIIREIRSYIEAIENDKALYEEMNFSDRVDALDSLEFDVIDRVESLLLTTVFFLYTPFEGRMLEQVLKRLRDESRTREIKLYTYGPCTLQVAQQNWLERVDRNGSEVYRLAIFKTPEQGLGAA